MYGCRNDGLPNSAWFTPLTHCFKSSILKMHFVCLCNVLHTLSLAGLQSDEFEACSCLLVYVRLHVVEYRLAVDEVTIVVLFIVLCVCIA